MVQIKIEQKHIIDKKWMYEAYLPLKSINGHTQFKWDDLKEIRFKTLNDTKFEIGDFKLIEFRGNPKNQINGKVYKNIFKSFNLNIFLS